METATKPRHIGKNISRIRELRGMKQEALAVAIGVSQQSVSSIEASESIDDEKLQAIAKVLGVTAEAIKNFSEEGVINYFNNIYDNDFSNSTGALAQSCTFNPFDKVVELFEEKEKLYERLLQAERDKVALLEKLIK
ncbi:helix-turn-helix transcriptional regulator [Flavobacterium tructae]|jgi:transcriptional regulator with XRE-family HTH domain|uniref:helix-turn-helix domain-containing protein n=1 Tax=Flavobacterium tructae TaxID=1114873 RepID=UPI002551DB3F|nr:helix-turn-helix transcriptional regulator [Flavobacterium tructae]MDL2142525.1 helix-turn-helix transcriptional regulator [Flavobacterium tructae]